MTSAPGRLFVISAPSGAGKTTLTRRLLAADPNLSFSVSYTTRSPRPGEHEGRDYYYVNRDAFEKMIAAGELLEYARVFENYYGTGRSQVEANTAAGRHVLLDIDWQGARQVRERMPESVLIFVMPPSLTELERRLRGRATDSDEVIRHRLAEAREEMSHWAEFDYVVVNDDVERALVTLQDVVAGRGTSSRTTNPLLREQVQAIFPTKT